jgi:DNA-binding transcriptional regulator LsrR (DeoR family)
VTSRKKMKAANRLANEYGIQRAAVVKAAMERAEQRSAELGHELAEQYSPRWEQPEGWTEEKVADLVKEITGKG